MKRGLAAGVACCGATDLAAAFVPTPAGRALRGDVTEQASAGVPTEAPLAPQAVRNHGLAWGGVALLAAAGAQAGRRKGARSGRKTRGTLVTRAYVPDAATLAAAEAEAKLAKVKVGDAFPAGVSLDVGFPPEKLGVADFCKGKKVVLVGLPGAFTPT